MSFSRLFLALGIVAAATAHADTNYHALSGGPYAQNWSNVDLITTDDIWSGVPSMEGYRGDNLTSAQGADPQTILVFGSSPLDVNANRTDPSAFNTGGVVEVQGGTEIAGNPVVGFQGSNTADAPFLLLRLNTQGCGAISVSYLLRDIDTADNAVAGQPVVLQARSGESSDFSNVANTFIQTANNGATSSFNVTLDSAFQNQPQVQLRWLTTNAAASSDALIGVDDINVSCGGGTDLPPTVSSTQPANLASNVGRDANIVVQFSEPVQTNGTWFALNCASSGSVAFTVSGVGSSRTIDPTSTLAFGEQCTATITAANVVDLDGTPDAMANDFNFSFATVADLAPTVASTIPVDNAGNVPIGTNVTVNFSEPVTTSGSWYQIQCSVSGARTAVASGGPPVTRSISTEICSSSRTAL